MDETSINELGIKFLLVKILSYSDSMKRLFMKRIYVLFSA